MHVNLTPQSFQRMLLIRRRLLQWSAAWAICALGIVLLCGLRYRSAIAEYRRHQEVEALCAGVREVIAEADRLAPLLSAAEARQADLRRLTCDHRALAVLAIVSQSAQSIQGRLYVEHLQFHGPEQFARASVTTVAVAAPPVADRGHATLQGIAVDDAAVAAFVDALRRVPAVGRVELKSSSHWAEGDDDHRKFEIVCRF